jgi:hypothetical protein
MAKNIFFILLTLCFVFPKNSFAADAQKKASLEKLWKQLEAVSGGSEAVINGMKRVYKNKNPKTELPTKLDDPQIRAVMMELMKKRWMEAYDKAFTQKELDYMISFFSTKLARKWYITDGQAWMGVNTIEMLNTELLKRGIITKPIQ